MHSIEAVREPFIPRILKMGAMAQGWLTAPEVAAYLGVKTGTILAWARQGKIRGYVLSGSKRKMWRFRKDDLDAALLRQSANVLCSATPSVLTIKEDR